ncbi:MAG: ankyrin repeat domain-containing protein, partial [Rickettsiales bacterium]
NIVRYLYNYITLPYDDNCEELNPLVVACINKQIDIIYFLYSQSLNINEIDFYDMDENIVDKFLNIDVIEILYLFGFDLQKCDNYLIKRAAWKDYLDIFKYLHLKGIDIHQDNECLLLHSIKHNNIKVVKYLIECGANVNVCDGKPLIIASYFAHFALVDILIKSGADVNAQDNKALKVAYDTKIRDTCTLLEQNGSHCNQTYDTEMFDTYSLASYMVTSDSDGDGDSDSVINSSESDDDNYML